MGKIDHLHQKVKELELDIAAIEIEISHIDKVALMDDPSYKPDTVVPIRHRERDDTIGEFFGKGEIGRLVMNALRESGPLTSPEITTIIGTKRPEIPRVHIRTRVDKVIADRKRRGYFTNAGHRNGCLLVEIVRRGTPPANEPQGA